MKKSANQLVDSIREKIEAPGALREAAPWLAAAGTGALGYGLLRHKSFAPLGTQLRSLQEATKGKPFRIATGENTTLLDRIKQSLVFGSPVIPTGQKARGTVLHHTNAPLGGGDVEINTGSIVDDLLDKWTFDKVMRTGVGAGPGMTSALPNTMRLDEALKRVGGDPKRLKEIFPDFILKVRDSSMGRGIFKSLDDSGVSEAFKDPTQFIFQEKMPIKNEYRVHTLNNEPFTATHRYLPEPLRGLWDKTMEKLFRAGGGGGAVVPLMGKRRRDLHDFIRKSTAHLKPADGKSLSDVGESMHIAWDVAELPDGTFKLIEANPIPGTLMNPIVGRKLRRQVMGNWSRPISALGGAALAAPTGLLTNEALKRFAPDQNTPMKKTAEQLSWAVLFKFAAREGDPRVWRKIVDTVAKAKGYNPPTDEELNEMFTPDWESKHPSTESAIFDSPWFKRNMDAGARTRAGSARNYTGPINDPSDAADAAEAARAAEQAAQQMSVQRQQMLDALASNSKLEMGMGALATIGAIQPTWMGIQSTQQAKTPEERYAILGLGGGLSGLSGGQAFDSFRRAGWSKELHKMITNPDNIDLKRFSFLAGKINNPPSRFSSRYKGGLAGLGLGLGGAAIWNQLSKNKTLDKAASITPEEIALGLAGKAARPGITEEEILELGQKIKEDELAANKWEPVKKGIGGGVLGAGLGRVIPKMQRLGKVPGILAGAGIGAGVGGLAGMLDRYLSGVLGEDKGQILGNTARTGRLTKEDQGVFHATEFAPYAIGTQPGAKPLSTARTRDLRNTVLARNMATGAAVSIPSAVMAGLLMRSAGVSKTNILDAGLAAILGGTGGGAFISPAHSNMIIDLHNRGYSRLANRIERD
jgi:hypothetical protein